MFHIYRKNVPFLIQIAWSCSRSVTIWNEIENKSHFHICCQSSFKRWSWVNLPVHFLKNVPVNKILFAMESNNCELSHGAQLVLMWPCSLPGFKRLAWGIKCFKLPLSIDICRYLTEEKDESLGEELHNIFPKRNQNLYVQYWRNLKEPCGETFINIFKSDYLTSFIVSSMRKKGGSCPQYFFMLHRRCNPAFLNRKSITKKDLLSR